MTKVLNLDELETAVEKSIQIDGNEHFMEPLTVEEFINNMKEIEAIQASGADMSASETFERSLKMILRAFPTLKEDRVRKMRTHQVDALFAFVQGETEQEVERAAASGN